MHGQSEQRATRPSIQGSLAGQPPRFGFWVPRTKLYFFGTHINFLEVHIGPPPSILKPWRVSWTLTPSRVRHPMFDSRGHVCGSGFIYGATMWTKGLFTNQFTTNDAIDMCSFFLTMRRFIARLEYQARCNNGGGLAGIATALDAGRKDFARSPRPWGPIFNSFCWTGGLRGAGSVPGLEHV